MVHDIDNNNNNNNKNHDTNHNNDNNNDVSSLLLFQLLPTKLHLRFLNIQLESNLTWQCFALNSVSAMDRGQSKTLLDISTFSVNHNCQQFHQSSSITA